MYEKTLEIRKKYQSSDHSETGICHNNMAVIYHNLKQYDLAMAQRSRNVKLKSLSPQHYKNSAKYSKHLTLFEIALYFVLYLTSKEKFSFIIIKYFNRKAWVFRQRIR
jgi:hypothetical protein